MNEKPTFPLQGVRKATLDIRYASQLDRCIYERCNAPLLPMETEGVWCPHHLLLIQLKKT